MAGTVGKGNKRPGCEYCLPDRRPGRFWLLVKLGFINWMGIIKSDSRTLTSQTELFTLYCLRQLTKSRVVLFIETQKQYPTYAGKIDESRARVKSGGKTWPLFYVVYSVSNMLSELLKDYSFIFSEIQKDSLFNIQKIIEFKKTSLFYPSILQP